MTDKIERIAMFCDVGSIWSACKEQYGHLARLNFAILRESVPALRYPNRVKLKAHAYTLLTKKKHTHPAFYALLRDCGFIVHDRFVSFGKHRKYEKASSNVDILVDVISNVNDFDTFVFVTGGEDLFPFFSYLRNIGKRTMLISFEFCVPNVLFADIDDLIFINEDYIFYRDAKTK